MNTNESVDLSNITAHQAAQLVGAAVLAAVGKINCEPTGRVGFNGLMSGDCQLEYISSLEMDDGDTLSAYYYLDNEAEKAMADSDGDGSSIEWTIDHYSIQ